MQEGIRIPDNLFAPIPNAPWIVRQQSTPAGQVPEVSTTMTFQDILGSWKARWGINRMNYNVTPGLYCVGKPDETSPVLVTANYKMTFDRVREVLDGINAWLLVLDTKGINVWCAAGKGTFGTAELIRRIAVVGLDQVVEHRAVIVPQLGATGVSGHEVKKHSGFRVIYGPVRAEDLPAFLKAGMKATPEMRRVEFNFGDRLVLTPIELKGIMKPLLLIALLLWLAHFSGLLRIGFSDWYPYIGAVLIGTVFTPLFLPWIPGRAFSLKGWLLGMLWAAAVVVMEKYYQAANGSWLILSHTLLLPAISAYLAFQFTGASTYTSPSGVRKEMKIALPLIIFSVSVGLLSLLLSCIL